MRFVKLLGLVFILGFTSQVQAGEIVVVGKGLVTQTPDMVHVSLGVKQRDMTAKRAMNRMNEATGDVLSLLTSMGIAEHDMQTSGLSLYPVWDHNAQKNEVNRVIAFEASTRISVQIRDLDILGKVLDQVVSEGANSFSGLTFALQNPAPALAEARRRAVLDARNKAGVYAKAANVQLGAILSLSEASGHRPQPAGLEISAMRSASSVPIASGEITTTAQVTMVFEISE